MNYLKQLVLFIAIAAASAQDCQSPTYNFRTHSNLDTKLELGMQEGVEVGRYAVTNTKSATTSNEYLEVTVDNDQLVFTVKKQFEEYEKNEHGLKFAMVIQFNCNSGTISGTYYQDIMEVNKYTPEFSLGVYEATVPLPLPKNFDLTPFLDGSKGITATDYDLSRNTVEFKLAPNDYLQVESLPVEGSAKQFKAVLKLKEQILKLPGDIELELEGTDQGDPARTGRSRVVIKPDLTIEYNDPPAFKRTFFQEDYNPELGNSFVVELVPGTAHADVRYELVGDDARYFALSVVADKTAATVRLEKQSHPAGKYFLSVVVQAKRSELQTAECVILVDLKEPHELGTTVEQVLSTLHLEERRTHEEVFPAKVRDCSYEIVSQVPNKSESIFSVDETTGWVVSSKFDREDPDLFADVEEPQFHIVLQLNCANDSPKVSKNYSLDDIPYATDITHLRILVDDINDNAPVFQHPKNRDRVFAFPDPTIAERLMINSLMRVSATDLDAGLNAEIRFRLDSNECFDIHPKSGVIYPTGNCFEDRNPVILTIFATDRDGDADGNVSRMMIRVVQAMMYQIIVLHPMNVTLETLGEFVQMLEAKSGLRIVIFDNAIMRRELYETQPLEVAITVAAVAFNSAGELISTGDFINALGETSSFYVKTLSELLNCDLYPESACSVYPYIVVMSVFIVLFVASLALVAYFYFKLRQYSVPAESLQTEPSLKSEEILVDNPVLGTFSTPPTERRDIAGATEDYSSDSISRRNRLVRNLSDLMIIDESEESHRRDSVPEVSTSPQRRKSIRFNEEVERIETL
ncbi:protocadherin Fat 4-like [Culex pipiens pallens]|uniref:protocadherin Fat 4-like n=1 Tax=Culex pipiens pallens TaxID=42434 RepID=UPI001952A782|nr:protocadherin Fat 4-like [Culex pipiens pallens]